MKGEGSAPEDGRTEDAFAPGWFKKESEQVQKETKNWPDWEKQTDLHVAKPTKTAKQDRNNPEVANKR